MRPAVELVKETQDIIEKLKTFEELSLSYPSSNYFHESFNNYIIEQQEAYEPIELDNIISMRELLSESENGKYPTSEYFGLRNTYNIPQLLPLIMKSNIAKRVRVLDLSLSGSITENDALFIAEQIQLQRKEFTLLEFVDLRYNNIQLENNPNRDIVIQQIEEEFNKIGIAVDVSKSDYCRIAEH
ncbi:predicted protein [Naegleria gruberi]|uniref:Predicted protein n=1 Tax=Naegleria gruberi TaxID=5762 RepID=D2W4R0_NAEGR|nr:uncharacterized protein NAEGRDRAFT_76395 [Naegleria gruberi]EFC35942.1 predicted protein [Naegleria gruberi]|eukprot:XP_002668686.1 predicted protein [Naegleria gruberi strain NEG-M]